MTEPFDNINNTLQVLTFLLSFIILMSTKNTIIMKIYIDIHITYNINLK